MGWNTFAFIRIVIRLTGQNIDAVLRKFDPLKRQFARKTVVAIAVFKQQDSPTGFRLDLLVTGTGGNHDQLVIAFGVGYQIGQWPLGDDENPSVAAEVVGALQYTYLELDISNTGVIPFTSRASTDWVDPVIGGRLRLDFSDNWSIATIGYVGGFGIGSGSQLVWSVLVGVNWSINDWFALHLGYRILDYDYVRGIFEYDMRLAGPFLSVSFRF